MKKILLMSAISSSLLISASANAAPVNNPSTNTLQDNGLTLNVELPKSEGTMPIEERPQLKRKPRNPDGTINYGSRKFASEADFIESECQAFGTLGRQAARLRQQGSTFKQAMAIANHSNKVHQKNRPPELRPAVQNIHEAFVLLIEDAYAQPVYRTKSEQMREIAFRGDRAYSICLAALPLGLAEAEGAQRLQQETLNQTR